MATLEVGTGHCPHSLPGQATLTRVGALCESMESTKRRKHHILSIHPGVKKHLGHMGSGVSAILKSISKHADPLERSHMVDTAYQTLAGTLQRANVALLAAVGELKA